MSDPVLLLQAENVRLGRENALLRETNQRLTEEIQRLQIGMVPHVHLRQGEILARVRPDG